MRKVVKLGFSIERILMIDDSPEKLERNYGNHIRVHPYKGDDSDIELLQLMAYLKTIEGHANYRTLEKRSWRTKMI